MELAHIALDNLSISAMNMRDGKKAPDISDILPSVRTRGVLMPLLVRANGTPQTFEIVAGRRRFFAARTVAEETGKAEPLPCGILAEGDDADALEASLIENIIRQDVDEMTQYEVFTRLVAKEGRSIPQIAATFGLTERQVHQRLALGNLLPKIREAYRADDIDVETVRMLTMATKRQQKEWLDLYQSETERAPTGRYLKDWLCGGESISTKVALFALDDFSGKITEDLFGAESYFEDATVFWTAQNAAIAAKRDAYLAAGWSDVVLLDVGQLFETWAHEKTPKKKGGKVFVAIASRGEVTFHEGYVSRREAQAKAKRESAASPEGADDKSAAAPEVSAALQTYIDLHRHLAARAALLEKPGVALRLIATHILCGSGLWRVSPELQRSGRAETDASVKASAAQTAFETAREGAAALLGLPNDAGLVAIHSDDPAAIFARLLALSDADVRRILTVAMAESLEAGGPLVEALGAHLGVAVGKTWSPDDTFFGLVRDKTVCAVMVADIAGKAVANANVSATGKVLKQIVRDCLTGSNGRAKVDGWLPRWMEFPARGYRKDGGFKTATLWKKIKRHFEA